MITRAPQLVYEIHSSRQKKHRPMSPKENMVRPARRMAYVYVLLLLLLLSPFGIYKVTIEF
jgi:hypothetical protein